MSAGSVDATGCITRDRECCVAELPLRVRNCSSFVVYRLEPTPGCNMGYCVGDGVPCPTGLNSESGYTPCECESLICPFDSRTAPPIIAGEFDEPNVLSCQNICLSSDPKAYYLDRKNNNHVLYPYSLARGMIFCVSP